LPKLAVKCVASWKKYCPDYEMIEWNEDNFDVNCNTYVREAYEAKKWAFVSDYARLLVLVEYGGIYMDTDVEVVKPLDELLSLEALSGFEAATRISTGIMACLAGHEFFQRLLKDYDHRHFKRGDGSHDLTTNVTVITNSCLQHGLVLNNQQQTVCGFTLFPTEYFCPKDYATGKYQITGNTYCIHHFAASWLSPSQKLKHWFCKSYLYKLVKGICKK
jgi:hypothetical protein